MRLALAQARLSPPMSTKYSVGALLVDSDGNEILSTGYSLELPAMHAEQCCLAKIAAAHDVPEERVAEVLPPRTVLYTTMEPCSERLSGRRACADRILALKGAVGIVYVGIAEPDVFVARCTGMRMLREGGVEVVVVEGDGLEEEIRGVAVAGHEGGGR